MRWTPEAIETLKRLREQGLSFTQVGLQMGRTRGSVAKGVWLHILRRKDWGPGHKRRGQPRLRKGVHRTAKGDWTDRALTETWPERKARLAREARRNLIAAAAAIRNTDYEAARARYRLLHPAVSTDAIAKAGG